MAKTRAITFRLLKARIANPSEALKERHRLEEKQLADRPANKRLFVGQAYNNPPKWLSFFNPEDQVLFDRLYGAQAAAILFVSFDCEVPDTDNTETRWLAVCFGLGAQSLRSDSLESQFGLKVALNRIGAARIKSIDSRRPEEATIQTRSQSSKTGDVFDFGIDVNHIILQAITGKCADEEFGGTITGSDGLKLNSKVSYQNVDDKAAQIGAAYASNDYEDLFPWYGKITPVRDQAIIGQLNDLLVDRLRAGNLANIHLAPPEIIDYQTIGLFKYTGQTRGEDGYDELRISDYMEMFDDEERTLTLYDLKSDHVKVRAEDQESYYAKWPVYKCLSAEIEHDGALYVLAADDWYAIVRDFVDRINNEVNQIEEAEVDLPAYIVGEAEGAYNERAAQNVDLHLFDKALVNFNGERGRVEFCDLLSEGRQIIHVKRRNGSSQLSHLFLQGYVSAEAFIDYPALREQIRETHPHIRHIVPLDRPDAQEYEIVYAILHENQASLPFFSKVSLAGISRQLGRMRYAVKIKWVNVV